MSHISHPLVRRFVEDAGNLTQAVGFGRVAGQIYAYLYFSPRPRTLDDMKETLGISKGGASVSIRQLEALGAVQPIWVKGDRKDYYVANDYFGAIIRHTLQELLGRRIEALGRLLEAAEVEVNGRNGRANGNGHGEITAEFLRGRIKRLRAFQQKAGRLWNSPLVKLALR